MWVYQIIKYIPGGIGFYIRRVFRPFNGGADIDLWDGVHIEKPSLLYVGNKVSINRGCIINAGGRVCIGNNVMIGPRVIIYSQNHRYDEKGTNFDSQGYIYKELVIKENVWIGAACVILPGVTISENCIIAAGSVLTKSTQPNGLYAGNPAKRIKEVW